MNYCGLFIADNSDWPDAIPKSQEFPFVVYKQHYGNYRDMPTVIDYCKTHKEATKVYKTAVAKRDKSCAK